MKKTKILLSIILIIIIVVAGFIFLKEKNKKEIEVEINDKIIKTKLADDKKERYKGLSGESISFDEGMLYVYEEPDYISMWMKGMNFPLDIIWFNKDKEIVTYMKNVSPSTYPNSFSPDKPASYVLETKAGFIDKYNVKIGDKLNFEMNEKNSSK